MKKPTGKAVEPSCLLAHNLLNRISVIVSECEFLRMAGVDYNEEMGRRLDVIRETALRMGEELAEHECKLESLRQRPGWFARTVL